MGPFTPFHSIYSVMRLEHIKKDKTGFPPLQRVVSEREAREPRTG